VIRRFVARRFLATGFLLLVVARRLAAGRLFAGLLFLFGLGASMARMRRRIIGVSGLRRRLRVARAFAAEMNFPLRM